MVVDLRDTTSPVAFEASAAAGVAAKRSNANTYDQGETWRASIRAEDNDYTSLPDGSRPDWFWTGPAPQEGRAGIINGRITSLPLPNVSTCSKEAVLEYFDNTWLITEIIFSGLQGVEAYYRPPYHNLRHPMMFYYGHPAALYINKLRVAGLLQEPVNEYFEHIFETGVDEMAWDDLSKNDMLWPMVKEVTEYRREVYARVRKVLEEAPCMGARAVGWGDAEWAAFMGFEHERIHIETSTVLLRELPLEYLREPLWWPEVHEELSTRAAPANPMQAHGATSVTIGKPLDWPTYGWDNEYGRRNVQVPAFEASRFQVTNGELLEFVRAGGYRDEALWSSEGWKWRTFRNAKCPTFWAPHGPQGLHQYRLRLIWRTVEWAPAAPAIVNMHEARAYAAWRTRKDGCTGTPYRLMSEAEHHALRNSPPVHAADSATTAQSVTASAAMHAADPHPASSGAELRKSKAANLQLAYGAEAPVDAFNGPQVFGNAWTWCEDFFSALPGGYGVHAYYDDFSSPCYDGQHSVIMGGSFMSTGDEASRFARFHFRPHFHQPASFDLVRSEQPPPLSHIDSPPPHVGGWNPSSAPPAAGPSAASAALTRTALMHYGAAYSALVDTLPDVAAVVPEFPSAIAFLLEGSISKVGGKTGSVMDIGCGMGGVAFQLAKSFNHVVAIDRDADALRVAQTLQSAGSATISNVKVAGSTFTSLDISRPVSTDAAARVAFRLMDPCCIAPDVGAYDAVVVDDVLDRLVSPKAPLARMGGVSPIVKPGGVVVVVSGFDWDESVTDKRLWLGTAAPPPSKPSNGSANGTSHKNGTSNGHGNGANGTGNGNDSNSSNGAEKTTNGVSSGALMAPSAKDSIQAALGSEFEFLSEQNIPCVMFEHGRKFTLKVMHALVWKHAGGQN